MISYDTFESIKYEYDIMWISINEIDQLDPCISYVNPWKVVITYEKRRIFFFCSHRCGDARAVSGADTRRSEGESAKLNQPVFSCRVMRLFGRYTFQPWCAPRPCPAHCPFLSPRRRSSTTVTAATKWRPVVIHFAGTNTASQDSAIEVHALSPTAVMRPLLRREVRS